MSEEAREQSEGGQGQSVNLPGLSDEFRPTKVAKANIPAPPVLKLAAVLVMAHGALLLVNALLFARLPKVPESIIDANGFVVTPPAPPPGDMSSAIPALIWLGVAIVLAGALFDRQSWAWWIVCLGGGMVGIVNAFAAGLTLLQPLLRFEGSPQFMPLPIGLAGVAMCSAVLLLLSPASKIACGVQAPKAKNEELPK